MAILKDQDPATGNIRTLHTQPQIDSAAAREKQPGEPTVEAESATRTFVVLSIIGVLIAGFVLANLMGFVGEPNRDPAAAQRAPAGQTTQQR
jgi:hypothetical protein